MPRAARRVVPQVPHHVTMRGIRKLPIFFDDGDRSAYVAALAGQCAKHSVQCLAWCLMDNHVHLILLPASADGLRATLARLNTRHAIRVNRAHGWTGHLFDGRFWSYPMDDSHLAAAVRYVELNPVRAGLVAHAAEWRWSSARAHVHGIADGLTDTAALSGLAANWRAYLEGGIEAADRNDAIEAALRTGRPLGTSQWVREMLPPPGRRGRPPKNK